MEIAGFSATNACALNLIVSTLPVFLYCKNTLSFTHRQVNMTFLRNSILLRGGGPAFGLFCEIAFLFVDRGPRGSGSLVVSLDALK